MSSDFWWRNTSRKWKTVQRVGEQLIFLIISLFIPWFCLEKADLTQKNPSLTYCLKCDLYFFGGTSSSVVILCRYVWVLACLLLSSIQVSLRSRNKAWLRSRPRQDVMTHFYRLILTWAEQEKTGGGDKQHRDMYSCDNTKKCKV